MTVSAPNAASQEAAIAFSYGKGSSSPNDSHSDSQVGGVFPSSSMCKHSQASPKAVPRPKPKADWSV